MKQGKMGSEQAVTEVSQRKPKRSTWLHTEMCHPEGERQASTKKKKNIAQTAVKKNKGEGPIAHDKEIEARSQRKR
ncbi:hypothetical protein IEQ34_007704 [Dendrobium chrysotoxum]|uniref:Uncharacterized protein n=1 Tax=Dendrobium chrysotoxum TaxID=161865 RepID=A0AAV7H2I9_DENCH|nr:hypothetical protein IEQ34_007704 [Dendrobium chrysotoxum]